MLGKLYPRQYIGSVSPIIFPCRGTFTVVSCMGRAGTHGRTEWFMRWVVCVGVCGWEWCGRCGCVGGSGVVGVGVWQL